MNLNNLRFFSDANKCYFENKWKVKAELKKLHFESLSPEDKRREIAKDALQQITSGITIAQPGTYISLVSHLKIKDDFSINEALTKTTCQVCGLGSLALAHIDKFNSCNVEGLDQSNDQSKLHDNLKGFFSKSQLDMVEACFERSTNHAKNYIGDDVNPEDINAAKRYGNSLSDDANDRLSQILENIVENGEFVVPKKFY